MESWQRRWQERRKQYVTNSATKLTETAALIDHLEQYPNDADTLVQICKYFHKLAGAGGIYELTELCDNAIAAEDFCTGLIRKKPVADAEDIVRLRAMLTKIDSCFKEALEP